MSDLDLSIKEKLNRPMGDHGHLQYYAMPNGEHYALLSHLAKQFEGRTIVDIGTHIGLSALALSRSNNHIITLDIEDKRCIDLPENVDCIIGNMVHDANLFPQEAAMAVLDIDPHAGHEERLIVEQLRRRGWEGLLVCDDIHLNADMRAFWEWVGQSEHTTKDVTSIGHATGTGLVQFKKSTG